MLTYHKNLPIYLAAFLVFVLTFVIYLPALHNGFVDWDDTIYLVDNTRLTTLNKEFILWAVTNFYAGMWHPLTWISFSIDYTFWGMNPFGYHLTNVLLHSLNAFLVCLLAVRLLEAHSARTRARSSIAEDVRGKFILLSGVLAGLFFGLHPLRVESVAWVSERKDVLSLFFCLSAILMYLRFVSIQFRKSDTVSIGLKDRTYAISLALFALSLMSKPVAVTLPVVLLIIDWYPLGRFDDARKRKAVIVEKIPFFVLSTVVSLITVVSEQRALTPISEVSFFSRVLVACKSVVLYLIFMAWPAGLSPFHVHPRNVSVLSPEYAVSAALIVVITVISIKSARFTRLWPTSWLLYLVTLLPVLGLVQIGSISMADRYTYFPGVGISILAATCLVWLFMRTRRLQSIGKMLVPVYLGCLVFLLAFYCIITVKQIAVWQNTLTLWNRVIEIQPRTGAAYFNRGRYYTELGAYEDALQDMNTALAIARQKQFKKAYSGIYFMRANIFRLLGRFKEAATDYSSAIENSYAPIQEFYDLRDNRHEQ